MQLATIGYEGAKLADFIDALTSAGVERVLDVRQVAQSRRAGFSKTAFREALASVNIDYYHFKQLGDPKSGREAARAGDIRLFRAIFNAHIALEASQAALASAVSLALEKQSVLVCFERDPKACHRTIVAHRMTLLGCLQVRNLKVQPSGSQGGRLVGSIDRVPAAC